MTECYRILQTEEFVDWLESETARSRYQIDARLAKIRLDGHFGSTKSVSATERGSLKNQVGGNSNSTMVDEFITQVFL
jgi:hypothetical protein